MRDFLDVCSDFLAEFGNHVGITDFQRQEGVGGMLDELRAVDGGDEEFRFVAWRTSSIVQRTVETLLNNRPVDLTEFRRGGWILDADDDPVRMEEISHGSTFAQKFRIGRNSKFQIAVA